MPRLVRSVAVVVPRVLGQNLPDVLLADNQQVVQALAAQCSCESFRERVRPRRPDRSLDDPRAVPGEYLVEFRGPPTPSRAAELGGAAVKSSRWRVWAQAQCDDAFTWPC